MNITEAKEILSDCVAYMASLYSLDDTYKFAGHSYADIIKAIYVIEDKEEEG